jgi:hypothetical protein
MTTHVLQALREKRAEIAVQIHQTEARLTKLRVALANLDAATDILKPDHPDYVRTKRDYKRTGYFQTGELPRIVREALRDAKKPLSAGEIAAGFIAERSLPPSSHQVVAGRVAMALGRLGAKGQAVKTGRTRNARWAVASPRSCYDPRSTQEGENP